MVVWYYCYSVLVWLCFYQTQTFDVLMCIIQTNLNNLFYIYCFSTLISQTKVAQIEFDVVQRYIVSGHIVSFYEVYSCLVFILLILTYLGVNSCPCG